VSGHHDGDNTLKWVTEHYFPRGITPTEKKCKPKKGVLAAPSIKKKKINYIIMSRL